MKIQNLKTAYSLSLVFLITFQATTQGQTAVKTSGKVFDILIDYSQSYRYDLKNEVYSVYYMNKPSTNIKFHLSTSERRLIERSYYSLGIDKLQMEGKKSSKIVIRDKCLTMPKDYTIIRITTDSTYQEMKIDTDCDNYYASKVNEANKIKQFIRLIVDIIRPKPEVKNAPISDILYL